MSQPRQRSTSEMSNSGAGQGGRERAGSIASMLSGPGGKMLNEKINIVSEGEGFATFEIKSEDHTLGNVLRIVAMKEPKVTAAAYVVPHPLESRMELRIETSKGETPSNALKASLNKLITTCDEVSDKFESRLSEFKSSSDNRMEVE